MLRVLFVATIDKHILRFHLPYLQWFQKKGYETHVAAKGTEVIPFCDVKHELAIERSPYSILNIVSILKLRMIINDFKFKIMALC